MLPCATNSALGGGVHLAAFVQQQMGSGGCFSQQLGPVVRAGWSVAQLARSATVRPAAAAACGLLVVASACCPPRPRSGRLQVRGWTPTTWAGPLCCTNLNNPARCEFAQPSTILSSAVPSLIPLAHCQFVFASWLQVCASRSKTRRSRRGSSGGDGDTGDDDLSIDWPFESWHGLYFNGGDGKDGSGGGGGWHHNWGSSGGDAFQPAVYHGVWLWQLLCAASLVRSLYFLLFTETVVRVDAAAGAVDLPHAAMAC